MLSVCKIKNISGEVKALYEHEFQIDEVFTITDDKRSHWASNDSVLLAIANEEFEIHDSVGAIDGISSQIDWLKDQAPINADLGDTAATSTGQSYPVPVATYVQADYNEKTRLTTDYFGNLNIRGPVFTDEGSFRDDFSSDGLITTLTGTATFTKDSDVVTGVGCSFEDETFQDSFIKHEDDPDICFAQIKYVKDGVIYLWEPYTGDYTSGTAKHTRWYPLIENDGVLSNEYSCVKLTSGLSTGAFYITRSMDYGPMKARSYLKISKRILNSRLCFGVADGYAEYSDVAATFIFSGDINTQVICFSKSTNDADNMQSTTVSLPNGQTTNLFNSYALDIRNDRVLFYINNILVATHDKHIPGPYAEVDMYISNSTLDTQTETVDLWVDYTLLINNNEVDIADKYLEPKEVDGRRVYHETPRRLGTYSYFTCADDDHTDPTKVGGTTNIADFCDHHSVSDSATKVIYGDFNTIENETHIKDGRVQFLGARNDLVDFEFVPQITAYTSGSGTTFNLYGGYLIVPAAGTGLITLTETPKLVQCIANEFGVKPAGYWNADWDHNTKAFINLTAASYGDGNYNIFGVEVVLARFGNRLRLLGDGVDFHETSDITQLGHGMRMRMTVVTTGTDHEWWWNAKFNLYRKKTC